jgi:hypothetical protein
MFLGQAIYVLGPLQINGVPEDYSRDGEIEARSPVSLIFESAVTDFA